MKIEKCALFSLQNARHEHPQSIEETYFIQSNENGYCSYYRGRVLQYDDELNFLSSQPTGVDVGEMNSGHHTFDFPLYSGAGALYGVVPESQYNEPFIIKITNERPELVSYIENIEISPFSYAYFDGVMYIRNNEQVLEFDVNSRELLQKELKCYKECSFFSSNKHFFMIDLVKFSLVKLGKNGELNEFLLEDTTSHGYSDERTIGGIELSFIQSLKCVLYRDGYALLAVYLYSEDIINYIKEEERIKDKIEQNPEILAQTSDKLIKIEQEIPQTSDCDVLFLDKVPAREHLDNEKILIERTDPRQTIYLENLKYYGDLRNFYEDGYLLIDFSSMSTRYFKGIIESFSMLGTLQQRINLYLCEEGEFLLFLDKYFSGLEIVPNKLRLSASNENIKLGE